VLCVRPYTVDLNGTAKENIKATGSFMCRRNFGGIGGCRGGGGTSVWCWGAGDSRGDGCGECKVDEDVDVEGCASACGFVADVVMRCEGGRPAVVRWR
jgi:hypothetical protein